MTRDKVLMGMVLFFIFILASTAWTGIPQLLNYQGRLTTAGGTPVSDGSYSVTFTIYNAPTGGTVYWSETKSVTTSTGMFSTLLGSVTPVPDSAFADSVRYLSVKIAADPELTPRQRLASVPYAYRAGSLAALFPEQAELDSCLLDTFPTSCTPVLQTIPPFDAKVGDFVSVGGFAGGSSPNGLFYVTNGDGATISLEGGSGNVNACGKARFGEGHWNPGEFSFVTGCNNRTIGNYSFAAGQQAIAFHLGSFVWNDATGTVSSERDNQFRVRATGGVNIVGASTITSVPHLRVDGSISIFNSLGNPPNGNTSLFFGQENVLPGVLGEWGIQYYRPSPGKGGLNFWKPTGTVGGFANNILFLDDNHNVGINTASPDARLHVVEPNVPNGQEAVQVDFANGSTATTAIGIRVISTPLAKATAGEQIGVFAEVSSMPPSPQQGSCQGRLALEQSFPAPGSGNFRGVFGMANPWLLVNNYGANKSMGLGGHFITDVNTSISLNGNGTYWVGGVLGEVNGAVNGNPGTGAVAGVIGVDNNTGTATSFAGYFDGDVCVTGTTFTTLGGVCTSDARYKKDVESLSSSLDKVLSMRGVNYRWRREEFPEKKFPEGNQIGFIAQEVKDIVPEVVHLGKDGFYSIDYSKITPLLLEAIKELKTENDALRAQLKSTNIELSELARVVESILAQQNGSKNGSDGLVMNK